MAEPITTAGVLEAPVSVENPRKTVIKSIREKMRKMDASDEDYEDALEALLELSKE